MIPVARHDAFIEMVCRARGRTLDASEPRARRQGDLRSTRAARLWWLRPRACSGETSRAGGPALANLGSCAPR